MKITEKGILGLSALLLTASCYATTDLASRHYEFEANQGKVLTNPFPWQLSMKCNLSTKAGKNILSVHMLKFSGMINNHVLKEGEKVSIEIKDNDTLNISVDRGAQVEITNYGTSSVMADCEL